jgi:hydrogenase expression/formation protein HypD
MASDELKEIIEFLKNYDGPEMTIMEVCGSHTGAISKSGIPGLLSEKIRLLSGPGCPVCVTPTSYVDKAIELSLMPDTTVCTFGDLIRVPGSKETLGEAKGRGASVEMLYSPFDILEEASKNPDKNYIFAAVGFETTAPVYALLIDRIVKENIKNIKLLTALKTMPEVIDCLMEQGAPVDGFIAPGHVSVITGSRMYEPLAEKYSIPFGVAGFKPEEILPAIYGIVKSYKKGRVMNFYPSVVTVDGNISAKNLIDNVFEKDDAHWRGLGNIPGSGLYIRKEYAYLDAGSHGLNEDNARNKACHCSEVLMGRIMPTQCPLYGKVCNPANPAGACMVSEEGSCRAWYSGGRER